MTQSYYIPRAQVDPPAPTPPPTNSSLTTILLVGAIIFAISRGGSVDPKPDSPLDMSPRKELLAVVLRSFSHNLEKDGTQDAPVVVTTADFADVFNQYGSRTTSGQAYKAAFPEVFSSLGLGIQDAIGEEDTTLSMEDTLPSGQTVRGAIVQYLQTAADQLEKGTFKTLSKAEAPEGISDEVPTEGSYEADVSYGTEEPIEGLPPSITEEDLTVTIPEVEE